MRAVSGEAASHEQEPGSQIKAENESALVLQPTCFLGSTEGLGAPTTPLNDIYLYATYR